MSEKTSNKAVKTRRISFGSQNPPRSVQVRTNPDGRRFVDVGDLVLSQEFQQSLRERESDARK